MDALLAARYRTLALEALARPLSPFRELPARLLVADVARQRMALFVEGKPLGEWVISTAKNGLGCEEGSYRTPTGWHRLHQRIGAGAERGTVFRHRVPTGEMWRGEAREEDLILTRVVTLEGLEPGFNQGPGRDTLERFIYLHGTNHEHQLGQPVSHGCLRLGNAAMEELFGLIEEGDALLIADAPLQPFCGRLHFAGVGGSGMSALAQFVALRGGAVSGSDRAFDQGQRPEAQALLQACGITLHPQDGRGVQGDCAGLVYSTAVEEEVPDFAEAKRLNVPLIHRSELLAHLVNHHRTLAITGTSGKSTTTAMVFEILRGTGREPSLITGGDLVALQLQGLWGNAFAGTSELLVIEADESDGSVTRYHPAVGVVLNLQRDHKEMDVVAEMFRTFRVQTREAFIVGETENLLEFVPNAVVVGFGEGAAFRAEAVEIGADHSRFQVEGVTFTLPVPGRHNVENALAALAACRAVGVNLHEMVEPLATFQGVARRFQILGQRRGVTVVDDFGHNPAKVAASLRTAQARASRVLAVFQPHGFGPMRFLRADFVHTFAVELRPVDRLWMLDIFYAGGTAQRDIASKDIVAEIADRGVSAHFAPSRDELIKTLAREAREGDYIMVMGARDPSLTDLARSLLQAL